MSDQITTPETTKKDNRRKATLFLSFLWEVLGSVIAFVCVLVLVGPILMDSLVNRPFHIQQSPVIEAAMFVNEGKRNTVVIMPTLRGTQVVTWPSGNARYVALNKSRTEFGILRVTATSGDGAIVETSTDRFLTGEGGALDEVLRFSKWELDNKLSGNQALLALPSGSKVKDFGDALEKGPLWDVYDYNNRKAGAVHPIKLNLPIVPVLVLALIVVSAAVVTLVGAPSATVYQSHEALPFKNVSSVKFRQSLRTAALYTVLLLFGSFCLLSVWPGMRAAMQSLGLNSIGGYLWIALIALGSGFSLVRNSVYNYSVSPDSASDDVFRRFGPAAWTISNLLVYVMLASSLITVMEYGVAFFILAGAFWAPTCWNPFKRLKNLHAAG